MLATSLKIVTFDDEFIAKVLDNDYESQKILYENMSGYLRQVIRKVIITNPWAKPYEDEFFSLGLEVMGICLKNYKPGNNNFMNYYHKTCSMTIKGEAIKMSQHAKKTIYITENKPEKTEIVIGNEDDKIIGNIDLHDTQYRIAECAKNIMSEDERNVLLLRLRGKTIKESAKQMNKKDKQVYYLFDKVRKHVRKVTTQLKDKKVNL